jgi:lipopolysaccharide transport system permease protein
VADGAIEWLEALGLNRYDSLTAISKIPSYHLHIEPSRRLASLNLRELWQYRELITFLTWRDIIIRYKQTVFGAAWAILQPLLTMVIMSLFFGKLIKVPSDGIPYPLFSLAGLVPWTFFANGLSLSANSLVQNSNLISKIYFPRLALPFATIMAGVVDLILAFIVLIGMMIFYGVQLTTSILWIPLFVLLAVITCAGVGIWMAAVNVEYRDVRYVVPFLTQLWMYATPIVYPSSILPEPWRTVYGINPMAGVVEGFRWALMGTQAVSIPMILVSAVIAVIIFISGLMYFRRMEKTFADRV